MSWWCSGRPASRRRRDRNHNGYLLRWDGEAILFDPGEGTQRQFTLAGVSPASITRICLSHFHGDHCLGLPGVIMRMALDHARLPVPIHYPASGEEYFQRLRYASAGQEHVEVDARPVDAPASCTPTTTSRSAALPCAIASTRSAGGLQEPDGRRMLPDRLAERWDQRPDVGRLQARAGWTSAVGRSRRGGQRASAAGQSFAFIMDTAWCDAALELAAGADLVVCEATFLSEDEDMAAEYGHLTARQAGRLAAQAGARRLVLSHFSRRYPDMQAFADEAGEEFDDVIIAADLDHIEIPRHR